MMPTSATTSEEMIAKIKRQQLLQIKAKEICFSFALTILI